MRFALVGLLLLLAPVGAAQEHEHHGENGLSAVLVDGPASGLAFVNAYAHFGFALIDGEGRPVVHQNAEFNLVQGGEVLFSTTDTHEYDGLFSFDVRFTRPGPYQVTARSGEMDLGVFEGEVVLPDARTNATVVLEAVPNGPASRVMDFTLSVNDETGALIPHSDAIVEFRSRSGSFHSRTHLHIHEEPITFSQGFGAGTEWDAQVIAYVAFAGESDPYVPAVVADFPFELGLVSTPGVPTSEPAAPALLEQTGPVASAGGYTLSAMYDPANVVGVAQIARVAALITNDSTLLPQPHVDFSFSLAGPRGLVFASESLHEYDGVLEFAFKPDVPGVYEGVLTAHEAEGLSVPIRLYVVAPIVPVLGGTGAVSVEVEGIDAIVAHEPQNVTFRATSTAGPAKHSEVDVAVYHDGEPPLYQFKLHTHESGLTNAMLLFPHEGDWKMRIDPLPTVPEPSVYDVEIVEFAVGPGAPAPVGASAAMGAVEDNAVPSAGVALLLVGALTAALGRRR